MKTKLNSLVYVCCVILFIALVSTVVFYSGTNKASINFVKSITTSTVRSTVSQFDINLEKQIRILKAIGENLPADIQTRDITDISNNLSRYGNLYNIPLLFFIKKDGTGISFNNQTSRFQFSDTYSLFTSGKELSTGIETLIGTSVPCFYVAVPIKINGEIEYILKACFSSSDMKKNILLPFIENVHSGLVCENGLSVTDSATQFSDSTLLYAICNQNSGFFQYYLKDGDYLIYHSPTSANGVYFYIEIPTSQINTLTVAFKKYSILFACVIILLCFILTIFLMKFEHDQKQDILKLTEKLKQSEARYQNAFNYKDNIAWEYDPSTKEFSAVIKRKDGRTQEVKISNAIETIIKNRLVHRDYIDEFKSFTEQIFSDPPYSTCILKLRHTGGDYYWARLSYIVSTDQKNANQTVLGLIEDISDIKEVQNKYDQEKQTIAAMTDNAACYYLLNLTNGVILEKKSNDIPQEVLDSINTMENLVLNEIKYIHDKDDVAKLKELCTVSHIHEIIETHQDFSDFEYRRRSPATGEIEWISLSAKPMMTQNNEIVLAVQLVNIDNRKKQEMLLQRRAERDLLTDLYNKMTMSTLINDYLKLPRKENQIDALIMIDADNYKSVNDTFGHVFGDKVLIDIADSLKVCVKQNDLVGRVGGDEFMLFLKDVRSRDDITSILNRISEGIQHTYAEHDTEVTISASIGVAFPTPETKSFQPLYKRADEALYEAKSAGKNCYRFAKDSD